MAVLVKISGEIFQLILSHVPQVPPETGGILGGKNQIITHCVFDNGSSASNGYDIYAPDTHLLNQTIQQWAERGIEFYGIFHSHFPSGTMLSNGDIQYITQIMQTMPPQISALYFPIVIPQNTLIVYRADRQGQTVQIVSVPIEIV